MYFNIEQKVRFKIAPTPSICWQFNWRHNELNLLLSEDLRQWQDDLVDAGTNSSEGYSGAVPGRQRYTVTAIRNWIRSVMSSQCRSCLIVWCSPLALCHTYAYSWQHDIRPSVVLLLHIVLIQLMAAKPNKSITRAAAFNTRCSLSVTVFGDPNNRLQQ